MPRVLVIDDDRLVREMARLVLSAQGYEVVLADGGVAGIDAARSSQFDVAIVDLFMPDMNGLKVIGAIHESDPGMPMIAASGFMFDRTCPPMPNFESMAEEAGAVATLYKPFRPADLLRAVEQAIQKAAA
jgi:CheY-like chemotaxis protein